MEGGGFLRGVATIPKLGAKINKIKKVNNEKKSVDVKLSDGSIIKMEYSSSGREQVGTKNLINFQEVFQTVQSLATDVKGIVKKAKAKKTTVEFGVELSAESGQLTALILKGSGTANLKFTFEWEKSEEVEAEIDK